MRVYLRYESQRRFIPRDWEQTAKLSPAWNECEAFRVLPSISETLSRLSLVNPHTRLERVKGSVLT